MKIELPARPILEPATYYSPGVTSPYADPPLAPVFIIGMRDGARITLDEDEARKLLEDLQRWADGLDQRKAAS